MPARTDRPVEWHQQRAGHARPAVTGLKLQRGAARMAVDGRHPPQAATHAHDLPDVPPIQQLLHQGKLHRIADSAMFLPDARGIGGLPVVW